MGAVENGGDYRIPKPSRHEFSLSPIETAASSFRMWKALGTNRLLEQRKRAAARWIILCGYCDRSRFVCRTRSSEKKGYLPAVTFFAGGGNRVTVHQKVLPEKRRRF